jgi:folate-binding protein YgfZ
MSETAGWLMPRHFGNPEHEYESALKDAVVFDRSHHGKVEVAGKDAASFLHNLSTNDVKQLAIGEGCTAYLTTGQAKIVAAVCIYRVGSETFWLDCNIQSGEAVRQHLDRYLISEQVEIRDRTVEFAQTHVAGPSAAALVGKVLDGKCAELVELRLALVNGSNAAQCRHHSPLGVPGFDIVCSAARGPRLWQDLRQAGAVPSGTEVYETLRVEAGTPTYGLDIDDGNLPQEVGRVEQMVSFTKGCYIGQETVARIRTYGHVNRSLIGLVISGKEIVATGTKLFADVQEVGRTTSCAWSPRLQQIIALGYARRGSETPGTRLALSAPNGSRVATAVSLPFVPVAHNER